MYTCWAASLNREHTVEESWQEEESWSSFVMWWGQQVDDMGPGTLWSIRNENGVVLESDIY